MAKIEMLYVPVPDLERALAHYRDALGWVEHWREGDTTAAVGPSGDEVALMLDVAEDGKPGPMLTVDDIRAWVDDHAPAVHVAMGPARIPGGWWASVTDPFGNPTYLIDQSGDVRG